MIIENGDLKNLDIESKMISLRCSWVKRLYDESFHEWKVIPNYLITQALGDNFRFHSNLKFNKFFRNSLKSTLPIFYQGLIYELVQKSLFSCYTSFRYCFSISLA